MRCRAWRGYRMRPGAVGRPMTRAYYRVLAALAHCMVHMLAFELAITPAYAGHYGHIRSDLERWLGIYHRYWMRTL